MALLSVNAADLAPLVADLANAADLIKTGAAKAVNVVATETRAETAREITSQINLSSRYVDAKVEFRQDATPERPQAVIEIADEPVMLSNFGAEQMTVSNVWDESKYAAKFGSLHATARLPNGVEAPWIPRTGDSTRGIQKGQKQAGLRIRVSASGGGSEFKHLFLQPIKSGLSVFGGQGLNGRMGTFSRPKGGGKPTAKYGPSPYQAAGSVWRDAEAHIADRLEMEVATLVSFEFSKEIKAK